MHTQPVCDNYCWCLPKWLIKAQQHHLGDANAKSWWLYSAAPLRVQASSTMTWYPTLSRHWANQSFPYPSNVERLARKRYLYIFKSLVCLDQCSNSHGKISQSRRWTHSAIPSGTSTEQNIDATGHIRHACQGQAQPSPRRMLAGTWSRLAGSWKDPEKARPTGAPSLSSSFASAWWRPM